MSKIKKVDLKKEVDLYLKSSPSQSIKGAYVDGLHKGLKIAIGIFTEKV